MDRDFVDSETPLPGAVTTGAEPFRIVGAMADG